ncbi:hypothetical protein [Streptomyces sp. 3211.6]|uniref:hypothetical protein n=1 Tax=Streptomyces sp. 3211.6 TaxID=1938845 RepID=UPI001651728A|nr:hypothetical protein [Streptomyces sp. 3211.6]
MPPLDNPELALAHSRRAVRCQHTERGQGARRVPVVEGQSAPLGVDARGPAPP